jgi:hypothetical protein
MRLVKLMLALATALAIGLIAALPASAKPIPGSYTFTTQQGVTFTLLSGNKHLIIPASGNTDDALFTLSTSKSGARKLPFRLNVYGNPYSQVRVSSNGNLQFGVGSGGSAAFSNDLLPSTDFAGPTLMPFWDDLYMVPSDTSHFFREGIYTRTSGTKPHRTFIISWQGHAYSSESYFILAQAVFKEGSSTIRFRYGTPDNQTGFAPSETIGAQANGTWTQIAFDPPPPGLVSSGTQFTLTHH